MGICPAAGNVTLLRGSSKMGVLIYFYVYDRLPDTAGCLQRYMMHKYGLGRIHIFKAAELGLI